MNRTTGRGGRERGGRAATISRIGVAALLLAVLGFVLLWPGGSIAPAAQGTRGKGTAKPSPRFQPGELLVKFRPEWRPPAAQLYQRRQLFAAYTGSPRLDVLHQRYRVTEIRPLFPLTPPAARRNVSADATVAQWNAHVQGLRQRYATRAQRAAARADVPDLSTIYKLSVPADVDIQQLAVEYAADPSVEYAEPNYEYKLFFTPNDPFFSSSGLWGQNFPDLWGLHNIQADQAWDLSTGAGVTVAVIDTSLALDHPDIAANVWTNPAEVPNNGRDDDGNGFIDDANGWDFFTQTGALRDTVGHGTHVAGTIAAVGNNGAGVLGVAWQAQVMPLQIFDGLGGSTSKFIAGALAYAVRNGADVVNMSFGGPAQSFVVRDAIEFAAANGLVLVAAAGNNSADVKAVYPAGFDPVIAVAAVDHMDQPAFFSNFGGKIDLAAPGGGDSGPRAVYEPLRSVLSIAAGFSGTCSRTGCFLDDKLILPAPFGSLGTAFVLRQAGTSMAAPHVAGTAALVLSRHPEFTVEQVRQALRDSADDLGPPGRDARYGYGRVNAARAVQLDAVAVARLQTPQPLARLHGERIDAEGTVENPNGAAPSWQLLFGPQGQTLSPLAAGVGALGHAVLANIDTAPLQRGNHSLRLEVSTPNGAAATDTLTLTRLATRPYLQQISNLSSPFGPAVTLTSNASSADGHFLVWTEQPALGFQRVVTKDLFRGRQRAVVEFRYGLDIDLSPNVEAAISSDGTTIALSAPEDLSTSNFNTDENRNFQLFLFDTTTNRLEQVTHVVGGNLIDPRLGCRDFCGIAISADGMRIAFLARLDLDPSVGNPQASRELFYWDRRSRVFQQVTRAGDDFLVIGSPALSADGGVIAFVSFADLDPTVGNPDHTLQAFAYEVASQRLRQLTAAASSGQSVELVGGPVAPSPDGRQVALSIYTGQGTVSERTLMLIDTVGAATQNVVTTPATAGGSPDLVQFSLDGKRLVFPAETAADRVVPPLAPFPARELFQYDLQTGALRQLTAFGNGFFSGLAVAAHGRIAFAGKPTLSGVDPEGINADGSDEIYLLDPEVGGGALVLQRGSLGPGAKGTDRIVLRGQLVQPSGPALDPSSQDVALTVIGANGQLFRASLQAGTLKATTNGWRMNAAKGPGLKTLSLTTKEHVHYKFSAAASAVGLLAAATPYLTVEVQVGDAIFSNAQQWRFRGGRLVYP